MPKVRAEKASDATINPPHPGDPTSDVTREGGEPLHKPPQAGAYRDEDGVWQAGDVDGDENVSARPAAVPGHTGRDAAADGKGGVAASPYLGEGDQAQAWRDDPMPDGAQERLDWAQRGTDTEARINAALLAEQARGSRKRSSVVTGLETLRAEQRRNESENSG